MLAAAAASVLASWGLSLRLQQEAGAVARGCELAGAVDAAAWRLDDSLTRASVAAAVHPAASGGPERYWGAEAEATHQLDALGTLAAEPELAWMAGPLGGLRGAVLARMAATDAALREAGGSGSAGAVASLDDGTRPLVAALVGEVDARRRDLVSRSLASASLDRRWLVAAAAAGAVLLSVLALAGRRTGQGAAAQAMGMASPTGGPAGAASIARPGAGGGRGAVLLPDGTVPGQAGQVQAGPDRAEPGQEAPGLRVLLVEDNAMVRFSLEAMLADLGHTVVAAGDAAGAMALAGTLDGTGPEVLVTDLGLPDLDGLTLARRLRAVCPALRVVVASGRPGAAPGVVWLQKPFGLDRLRRALEDSAAALEDGEARAG